MRTIKNLVLFLLATTLLAACGKVAYRKTPGGMPYQLYKGKGTQIIYARNIVKVNMSLKVKDSVYFSSFGKVPVYMPVNPETQPYDISEILSKLKIGDSVIATQMMDTFIKRNPMSIPPEFKKGDRIITTLKVLDVFTNDSAAIADEEREKKILLNSEIDFMSKYLAGKNITAQKSPSGIFVHVIDPGTGNPVDSGKYVSLNYTGTTLSGYKFDSNTDTAFHHAGLLSFTVGDGQMVKGFDEGVRFLKVGGSARVYVPSMLAYGPRPRPGSGIKPFEHLVFDITIVDVKDKAPVVKPEETPVPKRKN
ncbi:MAG TPA: FKBP-type peptidyl-prolyl cis-trans isomerase [Chitinophagaceae bacterium]|nr:FKBP-type peptidyl-prolyl cis-trans isomerase [Chitinophagaceae bacterium]